MARWRGRALWARNGSARGSLARIRRPELAIVIMLLVAGATSVAAPRASAAVDYSITDLGTLPGGSFSAAYGINDAGLIVGASEFGGGWPVLHAVAWRDGEIHELGYRGGPSNYSIASAINNQGQIVGYGQMPYSPNSRGLLWSNGTMTDIRMDRAYSVNERVQVSGGSNPSPSSEALLWENGTITYLGTYGGQAFDVNNRRQVVGHYRPCCPYNDDAFLWENGTITNLGYGGAEAINDAGQVVVASHLWENGTVTSFG